MLFTVVGLFMRISIDNVLLTIMDKYQSLKYNLLNKLNSGGKVMRLSQPKKKVFWTTVVIAIISLVVFIVSLFSGIPAFVGIIAFVLMLLAYVYLALACALKGI